MSSSSASGGGGANGTTKKTKWEDSKTRHTTAKQQEFMQSFLTKSSTTVSGGASSSTTTTCTSKDGKASTSSSPAETAKSIDPVAFFDSVPVVRGPPTLVSRSTSSHRKASAPSSPSADYPKSEAKSAPLTKIKTSEMPMVTDLTGFDDIEFSDLDDEDEIKDVTPSASTPAAASSSSSPLPSKNLDIKDNHHHQLVQEKTSPLKSIAKSPKPSSKLPVVTSSSLPSPVKVTSASPNKKEHPTHPILVLDSDDDSQGESGGKETRKSAQPETSVKHRKSPAASASHSKKKPNFILSDSDEEEDFLKPVKKKPAISSFTVPPVKPTTTVPRSVTTAKSSPCSTPISTVQSKVEVTNEAASDFVFTPGVPPEGKENCLFGLSFVFTGEVECPRDVVSSAVKRLGGRIVTAPSGKVNYMVVGEEPGPSKIEKAKKLGIKMLSEEDFYRLIATLPAKSLDDVVSPVGGKGKGKGKTSVTTSPRAASSVLAPAPISGNPKTGGSTDLSASTALPKLWTEKYKPKTYDDVIGNKTLLDRLRLWLTNWHRNLAAGFPKKAGDDTSQFRAVLLSGPPGLGKTTMAHLVAHTEGFEVSEFNASDTRSKKSLHEHVVEMTHSHSVMEYFTVNPKSDVSGKGKAVPEKKKHVIIMDEVDGMSGGDRGGSAELIRIIKKSQVPIICICNDRQSPKIRSLANSCLDLRFRRPTSAQVGARLNRICAQEGLNLRANVIDQLVESTNGDIRSILNTLSTYRLSGASTMSWDESKKLAAKTGVNSSPFDVTSTLFGMQGFRSMTLNQKNDLYFQDFGLIPLMVQENYINVAPAMAREAAAGATGHVAIAKVQIETMRLLSKAADSISDGDVIDACLHSGNNWSLLPVHGVVSTVRPAFFMHGSPGRINFASWLGENSKSSAKLRTLTEIQGRIRTHISGDRKEVRQTYICYMMPRMLTPLIKEESAGIDEVIQFMDSYYLTKDNWDAMLTLALPGAFSASSDPSNIASSVKSAFTRTYNKTNHPGSAMVHIARVARGSGGLGAPDLEEEVEEEEDVVDDEEEDDAASSGMPKPMESKKAAGRKKSVSGGSTAKRSASATPRGGKQAAKKIK